MNPKLTQRHFIVLVLIFIFTKYREKRNKINQLQKRYTEEMFTQDSDIMVVLFRSFVKKNIVKVMDQNIIKECVQIFL